MCAFSWAGSVSHASGYLMPKHSWLIWPRMEIGLTNSPSPPHYWPHVEADSLREQGLIFFVKSFFLITLSKTHLIRARLCSFFWIHCWASDTVSSHMTGEITAYSYAFQLGSMHVVVPKRKVWSESAAAESPLWLWSRIKATGLLCHWKLHSSSAVQLATHQINLLYHPPTDASIYNLKNYIACPRSEKN